MVKGNIFVARQRVIVSMKKALLTSRILDGTVILIIPPDQREAGIFLFFVLTQEERNKKKVKAWKSSSFSFETLRIITQTCYAINSFSYLKTDGCASNMGSNTLRLFD